jgi:predicted lipase
VIPPGDFLALQHLDWKVLTDTAITETALSWNGTDFGNVHGGFHSAVIPFVKPLLDLVQYSGMKKVMVTGHSLGAAEVSSTLPRSPDCRKC